MDSLLVGISHSIDCDGALDASSMLTCETPPSSRSRPFDSGGRLRQNGGRHQFRMPDAISSQCWTPSAQNARTACLRIRTQSYRYTEEGLREAVVLARQALAIDPSYMPAAATISLCRWMQRVQGWGALSADDVGEACRLARQALEAERDDTETVWQAAMALFRLAGETAMAATALDRALALNPNAAHAWMARGNIHASRNQPEAAIAAIERARRLSPFDRYSFFYAFTVAMAHFDAGRFEQAAEWADRALHDQPRLASALRLKVAALAYLGDLDEARAELMRLLAIDPKLTIADYRAYAAHFLASDVLELQIAGLRLAGMPED
jgi:tetratricopeptide (TPR) repeat protein